MSAMKASRKLSVRDSLRDKWLVFHLNIFLCIWTGTFNKLALVWPYLLHVGMKSIQPSWTVGHTWLSKANMTKLSDTMTLQHITIYGLVFPSLVTLSENIWRHNAVAFNASVFTCMEKYNTEVEVLLSFVNTIVSLNIQIQKYFILFMVVHFILLPVALTFAATPDDLSEREKEI